MEKNGRKNFNKSINEIQWKNDDSQTFSLLCRSKTSSSVRKNVRLSGFHKCNNLKREDAQTERI